MALNPLSQTDIVQQFLSQKEIGTEIVDRTKVPGLAYFFQRPAGRGKPKEGVTQVALLKNAHLKGIGEIAALLANVADYRLGCVGFQWRVGEPTVKLWYYEGYDSETGMDAQEKASLVEVLTNVLKSRRNLTSIKLEYGSNVVELTYVA